ncbi:MAG TPA: hypothetical protein VEY88_20785 [Archangium sp.]|nr:hypothetical protein [Myxococcaceae bacterium]HZH78478.1 hypothetical protein [Archangium sp.]
MPKSKAKSTIWLSYDLGVKGDYDGLYSWLDSHGARECGESVAFIPNYAHSRALLESLREDLKGAVEIGQYDRIYVIYENDEGKMKGKFLFGRRKRAPWTGFSPSTEGDVEDEG